MTKTSPPGGPLPIFTLLLLVTAAGGCGERDVTFDITDVRPVEAAPPVEEAPSAAATSATLAWAAPEGWRDLGPRPMREVTFAPAGTEQTEVYVAVLGGSGGGLAANVNRWRQKQMGQAPLEAEELAALPRLDVLGTEGVLIEIEGDFRGGMGAKPVMDALMLALVVERVDSAVFVKMVGPADEVQPQREAFETFCRSLRVRK